MSDAWIQAIGGKKISLDNPNWKDFDIKNIANSLSRLCRFGGDLRDGIEIYSVAQHSVLVSQQVEKKFALCGLLHDASEAICVDLPSPIKARFPAYKEMESIFYLAIAKRFDIQNPEPIEVKEADIRMLLTEKRDLLPLTLEQWEYEKNFKPYEHFKIDDCWLPSRASKEFLKRFYELGGK